MSINRRLVVAGAAAVLALPAAARPKGARATGLSGDWAGFYIYGFDRAAFDNSDARVPFTARLREDARGFVGRTDEPNTFADPAVKRLAANLAGARTAQAMQFVKTYATADVRHSVDYRGEIDRAFTKVEGVWAIGGGDGGLWRMMRREAVVS